MSVAQIIYEQYKVLPKRVKSELIELIMREQKIGTPLIEQIEIGLREVKKIEEGNLPKRTFADLKRDLVNGK